MQILIIIKFFFPVKGRYFAHGIFNSVMLIDLNFVHLEFGDILTHILIDWVLMQLCEFLLYGEEGGRTEEGSELGEFLG